MPQSNEKRKKYLKEYRAKNREELREKAKKSRMKNREKERERHRKYREENPEKARESSRNWRIANPERVRETQYKWRKANPEVYAAIDAKARRKNPRAGTIVMTKYRRNHKECEWSYCEQIKFLHVHHILSKSKYPEYVDGNYHGRTGNNFICFCPFHHFAYHYTYSISRNDDKHEHSLGLLWFQAEQWADKNRISIEDLEIELAQMYTPNEILA